VGLFLLVVRLKSILTPAEQNLATEPGGVELIKQIRSRLIEASSGMLAGSSRTVRARAWSACTPTSAPAPVSPPPGEAGGRGTSAPAAAEERCSMVEPDGWHAVVLA
jgi:hypothetical protein